MPTPQTTTPPQELEDSSLYALLVLPIPGALDDITHQPSSPRDDSFMPGGRRLSSFTVTSASSMMDVADGMIMDLMVQEATARTATFRVMDSETHDSRKKDLRVVAAQIKSLQKRLMLETKIREAAVSLAKYDSGDKAQMVQAREQLAQADKKVESLAASLWQALLRSVEIERSIFKHIGGVLRWKCQNNQEAAQQHPEQRQPRSRFGSEPSAELQAKLLSAENRIKEQQRENTMLQASVTQLTIEQEPLRKLAAQAKKEARMTREFREKVQPGRQQSEQQLKLDLATAQADVQNLSDEIEDSRDKVAGLQLQLDDNITLMEEKDRTIGDLLAELEERTNQADMKAAADAVGSNGKPSRNSVWYREQVTKQVASHSEKMRSALGVQLKEAVLERERVKLQLNEQNEITKELRAQVEDLRQEKWQASEAAKRSEQDGQDDKQSRSIGGRQAGPNTFGKTSGREVTLQAQIDQQDSLIQDLRHQVAKSADAMAMSETDIGKLRRIYEEVTVASRQRKPSFSVDALVGQVQIVVRERTDMQSEMQDLQRHVAKMAVMEVELDNARGSAAKHESETGTRLSELQEALDKSEGDRDRLDQTCASLEKELEILRGSSSQSSQKVTEIMENHRDELEELRARHESRLKNVTRDLEGKDEIIHELEDDLARNRAEREALASREAGLIAQIDTLEEAEEDRARQARRLESEHENLRAEMLQIEVDHRQELAQLKGDVTQFRNQRDELAQRHDELDQQARSYRQRMEDATAQLTDMEGRHQDELVSVRNRHAAEVAELREQLRNVTDDLSSLNERAGDAHALKEEHARQIADHRQVHDNELAQLQSSLDKLRVRLDASETTLVTSKQEYFTEREHLQEQIDDATHQRDFALQEKARMEKTVASIEAELEDVGKRYTQVCDEVDDAQQRAAEAEAASKGYSAELARLRPALDARETELASLRATLTEKDVQLSETLQIAGEITMIQDMLSKKEGDIAVAQLEAETARDELAKYQKSIASKERDFKEGSQLVETMQAMVMDLKRGKAGMLDEMEDCKYREEMMRRKVEQLEKELQELTRNTTALESLNGSLETKVKEYKSELQDLTTRIQDLSVDRLGSSGSLNGGGDVNPTTAAMRADFRKLVNDLREEHAQQLNKEIDARRDAERELRKARREGAGR
ncbi:hypothetical protein HKX48_008988 [Thoreauomyces humboldtii]|nr:hypothetical protein HKX48_008988 [Thoreauomyces humboldtii]